MSVEILRRAADLMRERAQEVQDRLDNPGVVYRSFPGCRPWYGDAEHIASWTPAVALAVAAWVDGVACAERHEVNGADIHHATTVARTYLGESV